jgi:thioredoxin reductase (NADPH)
MTNARVTAINGNDCVQSVTVATAHSSDTIECDAILIRIGVEPNTELFRGQLDVDERGYVVVDKELKTSITGIWAVGDVTGPVAMTIATAIGHGASAAKSIALAI